MESEPTSSAEVSATDRSTFRPAVSTQQPTSPGSDGSRRCPECDSIVEAVDVSEAVCRECNVVVAEEPISRSPRPRYDWEDTSKARSGGRVTFLFADRGVGVGICENATTDGDGNTLSRTQRRVARDKPWTKHRTSEEVRLDYALGEIRRMGEDLNVPTTECERAAQLYRKAHAADLVTGRSIDGFATVCLLIAVRESSVQLPVSHRELEDVSRAQTGQIRAARGAMELHLEVEIPPIEPYNFLPKAASELATPWDVRRCAKTLLEAYKADEDRDFRGISPRTLAAAALHTAYDIVDSRDRPTLSDLSEKLDVSASTISQRKSLLLPYRGDWE